MRERVEPLRDELHELCRGLDRRVQVMEVCGTHTVSIFRTGLRSMLPENLRLVSGPGCPVCVTAQRHIDAAIELAARQDVILTTYGDMMRVPGRTGSLERLRAQGAQIKVVNSARTALDLARKNSGSPVESGAPGPRVMHMPAQGTPANLTLKKGLVSGTSVPLLYAWIASTQTNQIEKKDIFIRLCDESGAPLVTWAVIDAFPTKLDAPTFGADSNDVAVESMELMASSVSIEEA